MTKAGAPIPGPSKSVVIIVIKLLIRDNVHLLGLSGIPRISSK